MEAAGTAFYPESRAGVETRSSARVGDRVLLALIIFLSVGLSTFWAFRVPIFEEPDESAHFDYAISIATAHKLILARDGMLGTDVHPYTLYLEDITNFRGTRYNRDGRVPEGYGTRSFYKKLDSGMPVLPADGPVLHRLPYIVNTYPFGFYAIEAAVMDVAALATHGSLVAMFFSARLFCVLLLAAALLLSYAILRELRIPRWKRFAILLAIGLLPMTSWVFAYIQPDNLAFVLSSLAIYLGLRARRSIQRDRTWLIIGLVLGLLFATKVQYFIATALPLLVWLVLCDLGGKPRSLALARKLCWLAAPTAAFAVLCSYVMYAPATQQLFSHGTLGARFYKAMNSGPTELLSYIWAQLVFAYQVNFGVGRGLVSYWGSISWLMTPVWFGSWQITLFVFEFVSVATTVVAVLMILRQVNVLARILAIARRRSALLAWRLGFANLVLVTYFVFIASMLAFSAFTNGEVIKQGRYWLPFILANVLCATTYAPQVFPPRFRLAFGRTTLALLCGYSLVASVFAINSLEQRFYVPLAKKFALERMLHIDGSCMDPGVDVDPGSLVAIDRSRPLILCGWALDTGTGAPVQAVLVEIDKSRTTATYGLARPDVVQMLLDERFLPSGFRVVIPTAQLTPGIHDVRFLVEERERGTIYAVMTLRLRIVD